HPPGRAPPATAEEAAAAHNAPMTTRPAGLRPRTRLATRPTGPRPRTRFTVRTVAAAGGYAAPRGGWCEMSKVEEANHPGTPAVPAWRLPFEGEHRWP